MGRCTHTLCLVWLATCGFAPPASAAEEISGSFGRHAFFRIVVPDNWNGDLVVWNHGYSLDPIDPVAATELGPLALLQLSEGYAVAATSYRQTGWAVFRSNQDLKNLFDVFRRRFGEPAQVFIFGASLGGIVTVAAVEEGNLGNVVGALTICGAVAGSRNWDGALDLRLAYDAVCAAVPGAAIPGGAEGLPANLSFTPQELALAVHQCTGILAPPPLRTADQQARLAQLLGAFPIPESFLLTTMGFATFGMSDLVHSPDQLAGLIGTGNEAVDYGDPILNATIARVAPNPGGAQKLRRHYTPTGAVGGVKIVSLHTDKDGLVIVENERELADVVAPSSLSTAIVVEAVPTHCGFTPAELVSGWESLRAWAAGGPQPTAASVQLTCAAVAPIFGGPCRIDPAFVVPDMDGRIRPR